MVLLYSFLLLANIAIGIGILLDTVYSWFAMRLLTAILITIWGERKRSRVYIPWFPLVVRGTFGILQSTASSLSYYNVENYISEGISVRFTAM
ncbi:hypothetical protein BDQ17DRAFT_1365051 [Cyathus striatus]|nr:hypothetical protein BDQ17DRAFT_1365051 [Cyathus striatus]